MELKDRFKAARKHFDESQASIAKKVKIDRFGRGAVSAIESGQSISPNAYYVKLLERKGVNSDWLLHGEGEMMKKDNNKIPSDYEKLQSENSYLKEKMKEMEQRFEKRFEEQRVKFLEMIHDISGKQSEHKNAAVPNARQNNSFALGLSYVPASI
ncbi:helix-turn-helix transcriptional regulator [Bernardetia sp. ABR2-2B]|uniref:helix-turn-helix domain-containing protein n=1 Tax=Bernardetia sp. ABR2-2B TaxID=3127472 RepID=UPI0030D35E75